MLLLKEFDTKKIKKQVFKNNKYVIITELL